MGIPDIGNKPAQAHLPLVRGDQWTRTIRLRQGSATGTPIDLTGATLTAAIYRNLGGEKEADITITVADPSTGNAVIDIPESVSSELAPAAYQGDPAGTHWLVVKLIDSQQVTRTLAQIKMTVLPGA